MNGYMLIVCIIASYSCAMEKVATEYVILPPKNVLQGIIESTLLSVYVDQKELEKIYVLAECKVLACCLFEKFTLCYDQFRFLQITRQLPINAVHRYAGDLVSRDYVYLIKWLFEVQAPLFWSNIKYNLEQELFFQRKHDLNLFITMY